MKDKKHEVVLSKTEFKREHQTLLRRLKHPTPGALRREASKQSTEMKKELGRKS